VKRSLLLIAVLLAGVSLPAQAGWLVLRDGTPLQTRGAWRIADNRVTYSQPDGRQVSVMIVVIDPDATRLANVPGAPRPTPPAGPAGDASRKKFVINDDLLKKNRVKKPVEEKRQVAVAIVTELLRVINDCAARFPEDQRAYEQCCLQSVPH
jgi:hypothetical protein